MQRLGLPHFGKKYGQIFFFYSKEWKLNVNKAIRKL
jgi:hypothetical protein